MVPAPPDPPRLPAARIEQHGDRRVRAARELRRPQRAPRRGRVRLRRRDLADLLRDGRPHGRAARADQLVRARRRRRALPVRARGQPSWVDGMVYALPSETFEATPVDPRARQLRRGAPTPPRPGRSRPTSRCATRRSASAAASRSGGSRSGTR